MNSKTPKLAHLGYVMLISLAMFLFMGIVIQVMELGLIANVILVQFIAITLPVLLYLFLFLELSFKEVIERLGFRKISFKNCVLSFFIALTTIPIAAFANYLVLRIIAHFGTPYQSYVPIAQDLPELALYLILISLSAGILEEIAFRGFFQNSLNPKKPALAIILTSLLFAVFHLDIQKLLSLMIISSVFGYLVYRTKSIFSSIIAHIANNGFAVTMGYLFLRYVEDSQGNELFSDLSPGEAVALNPTSELLGLMLFAFIFAFIFARLIIKLNKNTAHLHLEATPIEDLETEATSDDKVLEEQSYESEEDFVIENKDSHDAQVVSDIESSKFKNIIIIAMPYLLMAIIVLVIFSLQVKDVLSKV